MVWKKDYPQETVDHRKLRDAIWGRLGSWHRFVIAVDGVDGAGKSTLTRYLAWQLGMPAIETDLFLVHGTGELDYRMDALRDVLANRLDKNRPALVEGLRILQTLNDLGETADFVVWVEQEGREASLSFQRDLADYIAAFRPKERADFVFRRPADD